MNNSTDFFADRVTITFNQVRGRTDASVLDRYEVEIHPGGVRIDLDWLSEEIRGVFLQRETDPESGIRYSLDSYVLTQRRTYVSWGATASAVHFVVETAAFLGQAGASAVVAVAVEELIRKLEARGYAVTAGRPAAISDEEIIRLGLSAIETDYNTSLSDLSPKSVGTNDSGQFVVTARDRGGSTYTVTFVVRGGITHVISRNRILPNDG